MGRLGAARGASGSAEMRLAGPKQGTTGPGDAVSQIAKTVHAAHADGSVRPLHVALTEARDAASTSAVTTVSTSALPL
jgi:hypothetical protein